MEQPALEKFVLAKLRLPQDVKKEIKRYLPTIPTPTARLIKSLRFDGCYWRPEQIFARVFVSGLDEVPGYFRQRILKAHWTHPPLRPRIIYKEGVESRLTIGHTRFNEFTGEPARLFKHEVLLRTGSWHPCHDDWYCMRTDTMYLEEVQALERHLLALMPPVIEVEAASPPAFGAQEAPQERPEEAACQ